MRRVTAELGQAACDLCTCALVCSCVAKHGVPHKSISSTLNTLLRRFTENRKLLTGTWIVDSPNRIITNGSYIRWQFICVHTCHRVRVLRITGFQFSGEDLKLPLMMTIMNSVKRSLISRNSIPPRMVMETILAIFVSSEERIWFDALHNYIFWEIITGLRIKVTAVSDIENMFSLSMLCREKWAYRSSRFNCCIFIISLLLCYC